MATITRTYDDNQSNGLNEIFSRSLVLNWEVIAYIVIFMLAMFTRFYVLGERTMSHDESLHTVFSRDLYERGFYQHTPLMHGPILFHATAFSYYLFGVNDFSSRIYPALLGVFLVMFPLLFRRWLGRTGSVLASVMFLISPLLLYYSRYLRHDIPSILSALVMFWAIMMYLSGPPQQRRRAHWLYLLSGAMLWNLGSKETAFIYIASFGLFLTLYWFIHMAQHAYNLRGKRIFEMLIIGILLGGFAALGMIVVITIALHGVDSLSDRLRYLGDGFGNILGDGSVPIDFLSFWTWTGLVFAIMIAFLVAPALWAYRRGKLVFAIPDALMMLFAMLIVILLGILLADTTRIVDGVPQNIGTGAIALAVGLIVAITFSMIYAVFRIERVGTFSRNLVVLILIMLAVCLAILIFEDISVAASREANQVVQPVIPGQDTGAEVVESHFTVMPLVVVWLIGLAAIGGMFYAQSRGVWKYFRQFPEFDILLVMGALITPWLTGIITFLIAKQATPSDFVQIGESIGALKNLIPVTSSEKVGRFVIGFLAWTPMMAIAVTAGLMWNWRRFLVCFAIFHALFLFFFTTVFTNIQGIATGMVYSLEYWLEQQEVQRGSQPQYYYALVILPVYEFLPIIGSIFAMVAGMVMFWRKRRDDEVGDYSKSDAPQENQLTANILADENIIEAESPYPGDDEFIQGEDLENQHRNPWRLAHPPFLLFLAWWAVVNLVGYSLAGEKMPWLGTHMTVPLILLSAWYFGRIIERIDRSNFLNRGWVYLLLLPFIYIALFQVIAPIFGDNPPFAGTQTSRLQATYSWLAAVGISGGIFYVIYQYMLPVTSWEHLRRMVALTGFIVLAIATFRASWMASFIHEDEATEFLVYAHAGPANKAVTDELAELSQRTTGGMDARIIYDNRFSWPGSWYMRDFKNAIYVGENPPTLQQLDDTVAVIVGDTNRPKFEPLLEESFQRFNYIRMWWPTQGYYNLDATRINNLFDRDDSRASGMRRAIFDIWWNRDYTRYSQVTNSNETDLTTWRPSDTFYLYIRKDFAAQVWSYGIGDATVLNPLTEVEVNACAANWDPRPATMIFDTSVQPLLRPIGVTVGNDGRIYVAEEGANRVSVFTADGQFESSFGQQGTAIQEGAFFERPHSVALAPDDSIFVVDTWNYRVRHFSPDLNPSSSWGRAETSGFDAQTDPVDGFWGPRDIVVDAQGRVYVSDTGNKRIRVYTSDGVFLRDIGSGGSGDGQLNEPAGITLHPDGRIFVGDTWNRRVSVFSQDGLFLNNFRVSGWFDDLGNRPYLAVDPSRELLYVTDPDAGRVLIYDTDGNCLSSFGQYNSESPNAAQFGTVGGIAVGSDGSVYVTDLAFGRVLKFAPYERPIAPLDADSEEESAIDAFVNEQPDPIGLEGGESTDEVGIPQSEETEDLDASG